MNYDLLKSYIVSNLNEVRGDLARDDNFIKELCTISALMFYKSYISNVEETIVNYEHKREPNARNSHLRPIDWKRHKHIKTINKCIDEALEESKEKLTSLNGENIFSIDDESNEHYRFFRDNISYDEYHTITNTSNNKRFSILIYDTESLPFIEKETKRKIKRYDSKREDLFGKQDIKIHKYIVLTFISSGGSTKGERKIFDSNTKADYTPLRTKRFLDKPESIFVSRIRLFFNNKFNRKSFKDIIDILIEKTYTYSKMWNHENIKNYILDTVSSKESNSFLEEMRDDLNHEIVHMKQYFNTFKMTKYNERFLDTHKRYGLPEVPFKKKMYQDESKGKYWIPDSRNPHRSSVRHEMKPIEFYARLSDEWSELKKRIEPKFKYNLIFSINKQKIVSSEESVDKVINQAILDYREDSYWLKHLFSSARKHSKKAKTYYKKAIKELYKLSYEHVDKVEKELIDLYSKNKEKVLLDIKNKKYYNKTFYITKNYLEKIDKVEKFSELEDSDRAYYHKLPKDSEKDINVKNITFYDTMPLTDWTKEDVKSAANSKEHNLSNIVDNEEIRVWWLDEMEGIIPELILNLDEDYVDEHAKELLNQIKNLILAKDLSSHNKDKNKVRIKDFLKTEYPDVFTSLGFTTN